MFLRRGPRHFMISIHAPREGGDLDFLGTVLDFIISIHAPREGGDDLFPGCRPEVQQFQSTPPARGATRSTASPTT